MQSENVFNNPLSKYYKFRYFEVTTKTTENTKPQDDIGCTSQLSGFTADFSGDGDGFCDGCFTDFATDFVTDFCLCFP